MIYLDNAATTVPHKEIFSDMLEHINVYYGNPSSLHNIGRIAGELVEQSRQTIAACIGAKAEEIIFTAGGSEADNLAICGVLPYLQGKNKSTFVTSAIEHHAVLRAYEKLARKGIIRPIILPVDNGGIVDLNALENVLENDSSVGLVSVMTVNNEIGSIQPIKEIGQLCRRYNVLFMTDAVQGFGHIPLNVQDCCVDLMSISGHKFHALKGVGALYVRQGILLEPLIVGGMQERGFRAGTENVPGVYSMKLAANYFLDETYMEHTYIQFWNLKEKFLQELDKANIQYRVNGKNCVPHIVSLTLDGCESGAVLLLLNDRGVCVSAGSACSSGSLEVSHVLKAIGLSETDAGCTIRVSMSVYNTENEMVLAARAIKEVTEQLSVIGTGVML